MDFIESINRLSLRCQELAWEGTFSEYLQLVLENPLLARNAHKRVYDMIAAQGWNWEGGTNSYRFFSEELYGIEETLRILVEEYLKPAALGMDVKNRVLLLMGPVGAGKSTIVRLIKRGLERYSASGEGALYGIKGCPMHEEPLHLVPVELRGELKARGIPVEGTLCPSCRLRVRLEYAGRVSEVPVERIFISESDRVGIGTFVPSDPKSQDIAELTGSIDFSSITEYGTESDPRAYRFDGELNKANRGVMEFQELLKCDRRFLYNLLSLAQEGNFKAGRFALISADELVIGHTNQEEYEQFVREGSNEALASRLYVIPVPYNLRLSQEERIYMKLLEGQEGSEVHLAPYALRTAAMFSILTRLQDPRRQGVSLVKKMYLYDGCLEGSYTPEDVEELRRETRGEGMGGVDPRYVLNRICSALASASRCVFPLDILESLKKGLGSHPSIARSDIDRLERLLFLAGNEYRQLVRKDLAQACLSCYPGAASQVFAAYLNSVALFLKGPAPQDVRESMKQGRESGEKAWAAAEQGRASNEGGGASQVGRAGPDVQLMDSIEQHLGIGGSGKNVFREELYNRSLKYAALGRKFDYTAHPGLKEAVEDQVLRRVVAGESYCGSHAASGKDQLVQALIRDFGYCPVCAGRALEESRSWLING